MPDDEGYPTEEELEIIKKWPYDDFQGLRKYVQNLWYYPDYYSYSHKLWRIHTGGWSGNESIIFAMQDNYVWWSMYWYRSQVGGHYVFRSR